MIEQIESLHSRDFIGAQTEPSMHIFEQVLHVEMKHKAG